MYAAGAQWPAEYHYMYALPYITLHYITLYYITLHYMYAASAQWPAEYQTCAQTHGNARRCPLKYQPVFVTGAKP